MPVERFLLRYKHHTWMCQMKNDQKLMGAEARVNCTTLDSHGTSRSKFEGVCSVCIGRKECSLWCTYIHIHELYTYMWWKGFRQEHQNCPQTLDVKVYFFVFHSEQVHNSTAYDLACSGLLVLSGESWPCSSPCPALTRYLEVTPVRNAEMRRSFLNPHTFLHYLFMEQ